MDEIILDYQRADRCGFEEAVFCEFKRPDQIEHILQEVHDSNRRILLTRLYPQQFSALSIVWQSRLHYDDIGHCAILGGPLNLPSQADIVVVSGGASDASVCWEIKSTLNYHGVACDLVQDVGVAGLWRLLEKLPQLRQYRMIIAVAGMEAALPTVLAGLVSAPIIAVPTSVGYGVAKGGNAALMSCLASCSGGIVTVNIDNGYGAALAALRFSRP